MNKKEKALIKIIEAIIIIFALLITSTVLLKNKYGFTEVNNKVYIPITNDMSQYFDKTNNVYPNSLLAIDTNLSNINNKTTIYYYDVKDDKYIVKSGLVKDTIDDGTNRIYLLEGKERTVISNTRAIGSSMKEYKNIGSIVSLLQSNTGFLLFVIGPISVIFIYQFIEVILMNKKEKNFNEENI